MTEPPTRSQHRAFVTVSPGLEAWLVDELTEMGMSGKSSDGGVELRLSAEQLWLLHRSCRLAEHIRVRLKSFNARHFEELIQGLERLPWHAYLDKNLNVEIRVTCHRSRLWHSDAVAERTRSAIEGQLRPESTTPCYTDESAQQTVYIRIAGDHVQPAIDASGERLHQRGRRIFIGRAPLRETLAAALIRILNRSTAQPVASLWDPFCGSGSILMEWAESRLGVAAGRDRTFAFERWPIHDKTQYAQWVGNQARSVSASAHAFGSDIDARVLTAARANAETLHHPDFTWHCGDFEAFADKIPLGSAIVTNPPYGVRSLDRPAYAKLMRRFEALLTRRSDLRPAIALLPRPLQPWQPQLGWQDVAQFHNGGLAVQVLRLT